MRAAMTNPKGSKTMTFKSALSVFALAASAAVSAQDYQTFVDLQADHFRANGETETGWTVRGQHYFNRITALGPLDQFRYIVAETNVSAGYSRIFDTNNWNIDGELYAQNGIVLSAGYRKVDDFDVTTLGLGYLVNKDLLIKVEAFDAENEDTEFRFSTRYNHQLQGNDYVGFTAYVDDSFDYFGISSKYFASLNEGRYVAVGVSLADNDGSSSWAAEADYYFSQMTSVGLSYDKGDTYSLSAKHFFNTNWAVEGRFESNTDDSSLKVYRLGVTGQF